ncbi:MAG: hypothetical protein JEZ07_06465 [Phycisphaerae bacterium]|nr:hypothetical protein [Phycisphaerae bacterium]
MNQSMIKVNRDEGAYLATPNLPGKVLIAAGTVAVNRAATDIKVDTDGIVDVIDLLGMPIGYLLMSFVKDDAVAAQAANIEVFAGRDGSSFKRVFSGSITIGPAICSALPDGTALTDGLWAKIITSGGNDYWGAKVIGNACDEIAQLQFDLRGCRYLYVVISDADVKAIISGY